MNTMYPPKRGFLGVAESTIRVYSQMVSTMDTPSAGSEVCTFQQGVVIDNHMFPPYSLHGSTVIRRVLRYSPQLHWHAIMYKAVSHEFFMNEISSSMKVLCGEYSSVDVDYVNTYTGYTSTPQPTY